MFKDKQGIAFRGHYASESSENRGNFLEVIEFRSTDLPNLKNRIENKDCATIYLLFIRKSFTGFLANQISNFIKQEFMYKQFSIIVDETTDIDFGKRTVIFLRKIIGR